MPGDPDLNDRFPLRESLSPPSIGRPVFECAEAVYVWGFMPHAIVRIFAGQTEQLAEVNPEFGFATVDLRRPVAVGESLTATQEVAGQRSAHSLQPVVVEPLDRDRVENTKPIVIAPLYECGRVVPAANLVPSTRLHVTEDGGEIGQAAVAQTSHAVATQRLRAGSRVSAVQVACEGSAHELKGPPADPVTPLPAPSPVPAPVIDAASLIPGNDSVTLHGLLVGAGVEIFDNGVSVCSGWLATAGANYFPLSQRLGKTPVTATQELCGNTSRPSDPVVPAGRLDPPQVLGPICAGARFVVVRNTRINATVVVLRNGSAMTHGGAAPGDLVLGLGQNVTLAAGDVVTAVQYMNGTVSAPSAPVTVTSGLAEPSVEILGGHPFYLPSAGEEAIPGPVFPRGGGAGPLIRIQACCTLEVRAWIVAPGGRHVAELRLVELYPGYFEATWPWTSDAGWAVPQGVPVGEYAVRVRSRCHEREANARFFVVFNPAEVGGPDAFSFDDTAVWFGTVPNSIRGLHYYLHCSDWRVFRIALQAASNHSDAHAAAVAIARAEEALFAYSLNYHTNDVLDLITNYTEAQCADDAACLTALLRAVGIPAHPVTADAGLETGAANWTFDTWVEFLTRSAGSVEWRVLHPHEYPGMQPEPRGIFGARGVANKGFNDLIVMANENWIAAQLDDGSNDVSYRRNECGEPEQAVTKAPWIDELCESGYWPQPHWDCGNVRRRSLMGRLGVRISEAALRFGGRIAGTVDLVNPTLERRFGRLAIELIAYRFESKQPVETTFQSSETPVAIDPDAPLALPFAFDLPDTLLPGRELYLRASLEQRTVLLQPIRIPSALRVELDVPRVWQEGMEAAVRVEVRNEGEVPLRGVELTTGVPYALRIRRSRGVQWDTLLPGEERQVELRIRAVAPLASGSLHVAVSTANGGGVMLRRPFQVDATPAPLAAGPAARLRE
ncbi:MAG TPA: transglutaminase-like domain-containing protein [Rhodospirillales bacterium]|nr:transglutaminase-like domain-containing protein [Rhodospirillales bacterium]